MNEDEIKKITSLDLEVKKTLDIKGIYKLKYLKKLSIAGKRIKSVNEIKQLPELSKFIIDSKKNRFLNLKKNKKLKTLLLYMPKAKEIKIYSKNHIKVLDITVGKHLLSYIKKCKSLEKLYISNISKEEINISKLNKLKELYIYNINSEKITIKQCNKLENMRIENCKNTQLIIKNNKKINNLLIIECNKLVEIQLEKLQSLKTLSGYGNKGLKEISLKKLPMLKEFSWKNGILENVELSSNNILKYFYINKNEIKEFDFKLLTRVKRVNIDDNKIKGILDINNMPKLENLSCKNNQLTEIIGLNHKNIWILECVNNDLNLIDLTGAQGLDYFDCRNNPNVEAFLLIDAEDYFWDSTAIIHDLFEL